ncbi:MAG: thiamine phosphate synthase [Zoogloeaceae bacterium]|jgi:thiamine-phosphate pyrophosphorylase|nr:thiamine phosphate synthase [Zoogloeaceae bacterium]
MATEAPPLSGLYAVTPDIPDTGTLIRAVAAVIEGGCRLVQYRNKTADDGLRLAQAKALQSLCLSYDARLIVNDDTLLAEAVGAAGVHLGRDDGEVAFARKILGEAALIGASCYNDFARAQKAVAGGASYIAFGAVYPSPSKPGAPRASPEIFQRARQTFCTPLCAIGGITLKNAAPLISAGASLLAVISDLFQRDPAHATKRAAAYQQLFAQENARHVPQPVLV